MEPRFHGMWHHHRKDKWYHDSSWSANTWRRAEQRPQGEQHTERQQP